MEDTYRSTLAQLGAHSKWARCEDRTKATEPARQALQRKFEREVDPDGKLPPDELAIRAEHARKAYYTRLALKSAQARSQRKAEKTTKAGNGTRPLSKTGDVTSDVRSE